MNTYYTGGINPKTDKNIIPAGTVIEGKFSDLPAFFASLEGKWSPTPVTYKITQDETIVGTLGTISLSNVNIPEVIIDGNNKTISFTSTENNQNLITFCVCNTNIRLTNITNQLTNPTAYTARFYLMTSGSTADATKPTTYIIEHSTFNSGSNAYVMSAVKGNYLIAKNIEINSSSKTDTGIIANQGSRITLLNSIIKNCNVACTATNSGIIQVCDLTLSNNTSNYYTSTGGQIFHS